MLQIGARKGEEHIHTRDILDAIEEHGDSIALVLLGGVQYLTGQAFDLKRISEAGITIF